MKAEIHITIFTAEYHYHNLTLNFLLYSPNA